MQKSNNCQISYQVLFVKPIYDGQIWNLIYLWFSFLFCQFSFLHCQNRNLSLSHTRSHTAVFVVRPTRLWRVDGHFIGIRPNSMLALGSQLEGIGGERLQVLQQVGGGRLKVHFLLKGHKYKGTVEGHERTNHKVVLTTPQGLQKKTL